MSWFNRKERERAEKVEILNTLLQIEAKRAEIAATIELKKLELEADNIERRAKADIELREFRAKQRERNRMNGRKGGRKPWTHQLDAEGRWREKGFCCPLGEDPQRRDVSIAMILAHRSHESGVESTEPNPKDVATPTNPTEMGN